MTTVWPSLSPSTCATSLAMASVLPRGHLTFSPIDDDDHPIPPVVISEADIAQANAGLFPGILKVAARKLLTQMTVLADVRRPQVMIESESFVLGADKINLLDDNDVQRPPS